VSGRGTQRAGGPTSWARGQLSRTDCRARWWHWPERAASSSRDHSAGNDVVHASVSDVSSAEQSASELKSRRQMDSEASGHRRAELVGPGGRSGVGAHPRAVLAAPRRPPLPNRRLRRLREGLSSARASFVGSAWSHASRRAACWTRLAAIPARSATHVTFASPRTSTWVMPQWCLRWAFGSSQSEARAR
jgi:hypothetical protein